MTKLLVGNGLNIAAKNNDLDPMSIADRFFENAIKSLPLLNYLSKSTQTLSIKEIKYRARYCVNDNIERVADKTYFFLKSRYSSFSDTDHRILIQFMKSLAIEAIFYIDSLFKSTDIKVNPLLCEAVSKYPRIYTLNYYEAWDDGRCVYLHGKYTPVPFDNDGRPIMMVYEDLFRERRTKAPEVNKIFNELEKVYRVVPVPPSVIMALYFIGDSFNKQLSGVLYPSKNLFTCDMLFAPSANHVLYEDFDVASNDKLFVFGMSPYGDKMLIEKINSVKDVVVYIYDLKNKHDEKEEWKKYIKHIKICDDSMFYK